MHLMQRDKMVNLMLKKLIDEGIKYLTELFNLSLEQIIIAHIWKVDKNISFTKPTLSDSFLSY